jgi:elongation factor G
LDLPRQVEVRVPAEFQGTIIGDLNRRKGIIHDSTHDGDDVIITAAVPLAEMFGYSTGLRSMTQVCLGLSITSL